MTDQTGLAWKSDRPQTTSTNKALNGVATIQLAQHSPRDAIGETTLLCPSRDDATCESLDFGSVACVDVCGFSYLAKPSLSTDPPDATGLMTALQAIFNEVLQISAPLKGTLLAVNGDSLTIGFETGSAGLKFEQSIKRSLLPVRVGVASGETSTVTLQLKSAQISLPIGIAIANAQVAMEADRTRHPLSAEAWILLGHDQDRNFSESWRATVRTETTAFLVCSASSAEKSGTHQTAAVGLALCQLALRDVDGVLEAVTFEDDLVLFRCDLRNPTYAAEAVREAWALKTEALSASMGLNFRVGIAHGTVIAAPIRIGSDLHHTKHGESINKAAKIAKAKVRLASSSLKEVVYKVPGVSILKKKSVSRTAVTGSQSAPSGFAKPHIVGRDVQMSLVQEALMNRSKWFGLIAVSGQDGAGVTQFLEWASTLVDSDVPTPTYVTKYYVTLSPLDQFIPFGCIAKLFGISAASLTAPKVAHMLGLSGETNARQSTFFVDDWQWIDLDSRKVLLEACAQNRGLQIVIGCHDTTKLYSSLSVVSGALHVPLCAIAPSEVASFIEDLFPKLDIPFPIVFGRTNGLPGQIVRLYQDFARTGVLCDNRVIIQDLPDDIRVALRLLACLDRSVEAKDLEWLKERQEFDDEHLRRLACIGFIEYETKSTFKVENLIARAAKMSVGKDEQRRLHTIMASLERFRQAGPGVIGDHLVKAGYNRKAVVYFSTAANRALKQGAYHMAEYFFTRALGGLSASDFRVRASLLSGLATVNYAMGAITLTRTLITDCDRMVTLAQTTYHKASLNRSQHARRLARIVACVNVLKFELSLFDGDVPQIFRVALGRGQHLLDGRSTIRASCGLSLLAKTLRVPFLSKAILTNARAKAYQTSDAIAASYVETVDAIIYLSWNNPSSTLISLARADEFNRQHDDHFQSEMTDTVRGLAMVFAGKGELASMAFKGVENSARLRGNKLQTGWGLYGQAMAESVLGELEEALRLTTIAITEMTINADVQSMLICNSIQAATLIQLGGIADGLQMAKKELENTAHVTNFGSLYGYTSLMVACVGAATADQASDQHRQLAHKLAYRALGRLEQYGRIFPLGRQRTKIARESLRQLQNPGRKKNVSLASFRFQLSDGELAFAKSLTVL